MEGTDYAEQTSAVNRISDELITESNRIVCYNQTIYNDLQLESPEYAGLTLSVKDATVLTKAQSLYDNVAIKIEDDDCKLHV